MRLSILLLALFLASALAANEIVEITVSQGTHFSVDVSPVRSTQSMLIDLQGVLWLLPPGGGPGHPLNDPENDLRLARFSRDGQRIAFQSFTNGAWHIGTMRTDGSQPRALTTGRQDDHAPAWSADGESVIFSSDRSGNYDLWSVDVAGEQLTQLTSDPADDYSPEISPDGRRIAFLSERSGKTALHMITSDGTIKKIADAPAGRLYAPRFSPDGSRLAYVEATERLAFPAVARNRLVVVQLDTTTKQTVSTVDEDVFGFAPAWRDPETLLYTADGVIKQRRIDGSESFEHPFQVTLKLRASELRRYAAPRFAQTRQPALGLVNPVALPEGRGVIFTALGDLWLRHRDGRLERLTDDAFVERDPDISDDGRWLTYISDRSGDMHIWLRDLESGQERQLTSRPRGPRYPSFDHTGTRIAYQRVGPRGTQDFTVHILDIAGGETKRLRAAPPIWPGPMAWSGDDRYLTVAALVSTSKRYRDGANRLVRLDVDTDIAVINELPAGQVADFGPAVSNDGSRTALIIGGALWTVPTATDGSFSGPPELLLDELVDNPSWSEGSKRLTFLSNRGLESIDVRDRDRTLLPVDLQWQPAQGSGPRIVHAGKLFDGVGPGYRHDVDIVIDGQTIVRVAPHESHPDDVEVIDARERTVLPGLIDHHIHFQPHEGEWVGRAWLSFGVTTGVEPGGLPYQSREIMEAWSSGRRWGPRLVFAGPQLDGLRRHFDFAAHVNSDRRLRWELGRAERLGYGLIKTYTRLPAERQQLAVELAHELGIPVTAHAALRNLGFGGDRVEHLRGTSRLAASPKQTEALRIYRDIVEIMAATDSSLTPTLAVAGGFFGYYLQHPELERDERFEAFWPANYRQGLAGFAKLVGRNESLLRFGLKNAEEAVKTLHDAGVRIVAGTDSPIFPYGLTLIIELNNYVNAGLEPHEALRSATSTAAREIGAQNEIGGIREGLLADLIIIDGDPLADMTDLFRLTDVIINGRHIALRELLGNVASQETATTQANNTPSTAPPPSSR